MTDGLTAPIPPDSSDQDFYEALADDDPVELYEHAPCAFLSLRPSGHVVKVNATFARWTGHDADDLRTGGRIQDLLPPGDRIFWETHVAPLLSMQGSARELALELRCADGSRLPVIVNAVRTTGPKGEVVRLAAFDARERRSYEAELLAARDAANRSAARAIELASTLQQTLLPPAPPRVPGIEIGAAFRPAGDGSVVGGDFYDVFEVRDRWGVIIGDVCGKGARAATVTALSRYTVRAEAIRTDSPAVVLGRLHDALERDHSDAFVTAVYLTLRSIDELVHVRLSSGGHHLPIRVPVEGGVAEVGRWGSMLGILGPPRLHDVDLVLAPGEVLCLYTDGILEARGSDDRFFGETRLRHQLLTHRGRPAQEIADAVVAAAVDFQDGDTRDDIAVVVLANPGPR